MLSKRARAILRIAIIVLMAVLIGASVYSINAARLAGNSLPMPLGFGATVVLSGSMEPTLSVGDLLIVVPSEEYSIGDIVVYESSGISVVHRIIALEDGMAVTQGDANNASDDPISTSSVKGRVVAAIPMLGYLVQLIQTPIVTVILIILAIWLMEASFKHDKESDEQEREQLIKEIERLKEDAEKENNL